MIEMREIPGYSGRYLAGQDGHIYSTVNTRGRTLETPRRLTERVSKLGYLVTQIRWNGKNQNKLSHVLVALAFLGARNGREVNHRDGVKANNQPSNLEYVTRAENVRHAFRMGLKEAKRGELSYRAVLRADQIRNIRADVAEVRRDGRAKNGAMAALARKYGVSPSALDHIARGNCWRHIPSPNEGEL